MKKARKALYTVLNSLQTKRKEECDTDQYIQLLNYSNPGSSLAIVAVTTINRTLVFGGDSVTDCPLIIA